MPARATPVTPASSSARFAGRDLRLAAVDEQQVRPVREPGAPLLRGRGLLVVQVRHPAAQHLVDRVGVVGRGGDVEPPVLVLARQPVLEDDHRGDDVRAGQVRDVEALDPQRRLVEPERLLQVRDRLRPGGEVRAAPGLVEHQGLGGRCAQRSRRAGPSRRAPRRGGACGPRPGAPRPPRPSTRRCESQVASSSASSGSSGTSTSRGGNTSSSYAFPQQPSRRARRATRRAPCRRPSCACRGCGRRAR